MISLIFLYPDGLNAAAIRAMAASRCAAVRSPSRSPFRSKMPLGKLDQPVRCGPLNSKETLPRCSAESVASKAFAAPTTFVVTPRADAAAA